MLKEKGYQSSEVTHKIKPVEGGPKLVHVTFTMSEGPKVKIRRVEFTGNTDISDRRLRRRMKDNRAHWWLSFISGRGVYQETKFEEDAERVLDYYRNRGYIRAQVGEPEIRVLGDSDDKKTRWIRAARAGQRRASLQGEQLRRGRQHGREERSVEAALQAREG
ncbi:MAG: POTRA domain-containing protein [Vicinamibacterales bacterium]